MWCVMHGKYHNIIFMDCFSSETYDARCSSNSDENRLLFCYFFAQLFQFAYILKDLHKVYTEQNTFICLTG